MTLDNVPVAVIEFEEDQKFILVELAFGESIKLVLRTGKRYCEHKDIFEDLDRELKGSGITKVCKGGGRILARAEQKTIVLRSDSIRYGKERRSDTISLLQGAYPDFKVEEG